MAWTVVFHPDFAPEFRALDWDMKTKLGILIDLLRTTGPSLGRPYADTLNGSFYPNMKELRLDTSDDWFRIAYAFDPQRKAVVLCGGGKGGQSQTKFYRVLCAKADSRFAAWLAQESDA